MLNDTMVTLQGWVGTDVQLRHAGSTPVANIRVATTPRRYQRSTDEWVDGATQWYTVSAWRDLGEHCARSLRRGDPVLVHGRLTARPYINKAGVEVVAHEVEALLVGHDLSRGISMFTRAPSARAAVGATQPSRPETGADVSSGEAREETPEEISERVLATAAA